MDARLALSSGRGHRGQIDSVSKPVRNGTCLRLFLSTKLALILSYQSYGQFGSFLYASLLSIEPLLT